MKDKTVAVVLAGGKGERLGPLTRERAKPAVPFGGSYRIIDFTLSNCLNSGLRHILLLTQYKAFSLARHVSLGWSRFFCRELGECIDVIPPQQRIDDSWYRGTADAVYQNIYSIEKESPDHVLILAGDHIYKMDYERLLNFHCRNNADLTISAIPMPCKEAAGRFGVINADFNGRMFGFEEKPKQPKTMPDSDSLCLASMGIYVFKASYLFETLCRDATAPGSCHDFGHNVIPEAVENDRVFACPFWNDAGEKNTYWRDVGTIDAYYEANMDLIDVEPKLNLYDRHWPVYTCLAQDPPPKFVFSGEQRKGTALESMICSGSIVSGGNVIHSILGSRVRVNSYATVRDSILFSDVMVGRNATIEKSIIEKGVNIPPGWSVGIDHELDRQRGYHVTPEGITVVSQ